MGSNWLAKQSFGCLKFTKTVYFLSYICLWNKKEERRRKKKEEERRKMNKIEILKFGFSNLLKISGTFGVKIALE